MALAHVGDRWTLLIVNVLLPGPRRFNELSEELAGIAPNVLTQRLRQLEADRLVVAQAYSTRPVRFTYELTDTGRALAGALRMLSHWGAEQAAMGGEEGVGAIHQACGTVAEPRWWCRTCDRIVDDDDLAQLRWV